MKALFLLAAAPFLASVSCERHAWEETKVLHEEHGHAAHGEAHDGATGSGGSHDDETADH